MFGFVTVAPALLRPEQKTRYRARYCGLCRALGQTCGQSCRLLLTYDLVFLEMLLASVYELPEENNSRRCMIHPVKPHLEIRTDASDYAAAMNVLLVHDKLLDDWHDDKHLAALAAASFYRAKYAFLSGQYPRQSRAVADCLGKLSTMEREGEMNPDLPAGCFGELMGELFVIKDDSGPLEESLRDFGQWLGRWIYLMDAATDLHEDLKRERYNPLVSMAQDEIMESLELIGGEVIRRFNTLPITTDRDIMEHILCAGIWGNYHIRMQTYAKKGQESIHGKKSV